MNAEYEVVFTKLTSTSKGFKQMTWDEIANTIKHDHGVYDYSIDLIRKGGLSKAERAKIKLQDLPVFYTATFNPDADMATESSSTSKGYMCFDLDYYDPEIVEGLKSRLMGNPALRKIVFMVFRSPSGGLKFLIKTDLITDDAPLFAYSYQRVADLLNKKLTEGWADEDPELCDIDVCDPQCKNINRACFFSVDPDLYYNPHCSTLEIGEKMRLGYAERQEETKRLMEERARVAIELNASVDDAARYRYRDAAVKNIMASMYEGKRHAKYWSLAKVILETGGTEGDVYNAFTECQFANQWTEDMSPALKARDCYKHFCAKGIPQKLFYKDQGRINQTAAIRQVIANRKNRMNNNTNTQTN